MNDCENCAALHGQIEALEKANERLMEQHRDDAQAHQALMDQCVKFEKTVDRMMAVILCQATTIQRLTEERLGPEKSLYEQAKDQGIFAGPQLGGVSQLDPDKGFIK